MAVATGSRVGPYEVLALLGAGGMGEVYRARDTRLGREVALKVLPEAFALDAGRRARVEREARLLAALNHPNIATLYGIEPSPAGQVLVMELVEGQTLAAHLALGAGGRHGLPLREVLTIAQQLAAALEAAHEHGIIHRDLKPANIAVRPDGTVKVLDFGLATTLASSGGAVDGPTITATHVLGGGGVGPGTPAYMSPEQARGLRPDKRTDVWAFGCVLYELLTRQRAFAGESTADVIAQILERAPDFSLLPTDTPDGIRRLLSRCLEKDLQRRLRDAGDARLEIQDAAGTVEAGAGAHSTWSAGAPSAPGANALSQKAAVPREAPVRIDSAPGIRNRVRLGPVMVAGALVVMVTVAAMLWQRWQQDYFWQNPLADARAERLTDFEGIETDAVISPDGRLMAFYSDRDGQFDAWVSQIGSGEFLNISAGRLEGDRNLGANPRVGFSGDGTQLWITKQDPGQHNVTWLMPSFGGTPRRFLDPGMNPAWSPDGSQIAYFVADPGDPIFIADRNGQNPTQVFSESVGRHCHFVTWSPDGRFLYFTRGVIATDEFDIWRIPVPLNGSTAAPERMTFHNAKVGYLAWLDDRTLIYSGTAEDGSGQWLYAMDIERRIPHRVSSGVTEQYLSVAVSRMQPRRLVTTVGTSSASLWTVPLSDRVQSESAVQPLPMPNARARGVRFGPDFLVFLSSRGGADGLWKFQNGTATELWRGADGGVVAPPAVSADGSRVAFSYRKGGRTGLYVMNANGTNIRALAESLDVRSAPSWSPDGLWIAVAANQGEETRIFKVPAGGGAAVQLVETMSYNPVWSPDGRFILYFEPLRAAIAPIKAVTPDGAPFHVPDIRVNYEGSPFRFVPHANAIIYISEQPAIRGANFFWADLETGQTRQLTELKQGFRIASFDVSPDGTRIVFDRLQDRSDIALMELKR